MPTISLCMIVRNEEAVLERCLQSAAHLVEEIIILDTGSTDHTKEIAARFTDKIYDFPWQDDLSAARNFAFSKSTCEYLFWLDAGDVISPENQALFLQRKPSFTADAILLPCYAAQDELHQQQFSFYRERLVRRVAGFRSKGAVHEGIPLHGTVQKEEIAIWYSKQSIQVLTATYRLSKTGCIWCPDNRQRAVSLRTGAVEHAAYQAAVTAFSRFLEDERGWYVDCVEACLCRADCYMALQQPEAALQSVFQSFQYAPPTAAACCRIARYFQEKQKLETANFWLELAVSCGELPLKQKEEKKEILQES